MKQHADMRSMIVGIVEVLIVSTLSLLFLSGMLDYLHIGNLRPTWLDPWSMCYALEHQVTRILGMNPGGLWDKGFYYPYNKESLLFSEPAWGVALLVTPVWMLVKNVFVIFRLGGIVAQFLSWLFTYYFVKALGCGRRWAFFAGGTFCLSGVTLILTTMQHLFWPLFFVPLLGLVTVKLLSTKKWLWGGLWGLLYGYLAWSSLQIFVMGGVFLASFIAWHFAFRDHSRKTVAVLFVSFLFGSLIAGVVLGCMYVTHEKFGFHSSPSSQYGLAANWADLLFRSWPPLAYNPLAKMPLWEQIQAHAKGETNLGLSILLLFGALILCVTRLRKAVIVQESKERTLATFLFLMSFMVGLAWLNMHCIRITAEKYHESLPSLAVGWTYFYYFFAGTIIYVFRHRLSSALRHLDFYLFLVALFFGFLAFGPYYLTTDGKAVASPVAFLLYDVVGFSGIRATARWGLILSFTLSIAVAVFLSQYDSSRKRKIASVFFIILCLLELSPGIKLSGINKITPYQWRPGEVDIFLRNLPDGAVLELSDYPFKTENEGLSDNCQGARLFARTFHKKVLVNGYATYMPQVLGQYLYNPENAMLTSKSIKDMRKFGARYWVVHMEGWPEDKARLFKGLVGDLRQIAYFDKDKTIIYEDPDPKISVGINDPVDVAKITKTLIKKLTGRNLTEISKVTSIKKPELENFKKVFNKIELNDALSGEEIRALQKSCGDEAKKAGACIEYQMADEAFFANRNNESKDFIFNVKVNGKAKGALQAFFPSKNGVPVKPKIVKFSVMLPKEGNAAVYAEVSRRLILLKRRKEFDAQLSKPYKSISDTLERWFTASP